MRPERNRKHELGVQKREHCSKSPATRILPPLLFPALGEEGKKENNCVSAHRVLSCRFYINFRIVLQEAEVQRG